MEQAFLIYSAVGGLWLVMLTAMYVIAWLEMSNRNQERIKNFNELQVKITDSIVRNNSRFEQLEEQNKSHLFSFSQEILRLQERIETLERFNRSETSIVENDESELDQIESVIDFSSRFDQLESLVKQSLDRENTTVETIEDRFEQFADSIDSLVKGINSLVTEVEQLKPDDRLLNEVNSTLKKVFPALVQIKNGLIDPEAFKRLEGKIDSIGRFLAEAEIVTDEEGAFNEEDATALDDYDFLDDIEEEDEE